MGYARRLAFVAAAVAATLTAEAQELQPGPTAHFTMTAQGQYGSDGGALNVSAPAGGSVNVGLSAMVTPGASPILTYSWTANGTSLGCASTSCNATLVMANNTIALTVTDGNGKTATAMGVVNLRAESGPQARFTMSAGGRYGDSGGAISVPASPGGVTVSLSSVSSGGSPIVSYAWSVNGSPLPCSGSGCSAVLTAENNTISLTVTDSIGQHATATGAVRIMPAAQGPAAHFTMSGGGRTGTDGDTLTYVAPGRASLPINLASTSRSSAPIATYDWRVNGTRVCGNSAKCEATLDSVSNVVTLTITDAEGRSATTAARVNLIGR